MHLGKFLNLLATLLVIAGAMLWSVSLGVAQTDTSECSAYALNRDCLTEEIFEAADFEGSDSDDFKDLYLGIYNMIQQTPSDQALREVAADHQYTQTEMEAILSGDVGMVLLTQDGTVSNQDAFQLMESIQSDYQREYEDAQLKQQMLMDTYGKEIFANGDLSDSGNFDLIYDLEIVEALLFGELGLSFDQSGGSILSGGGEEETDSEATEVVTETGLETSDEDEGTDGGSDSGSSSTGSEGTTDEPLDAAYCLADPTLQSTFGDAVSSEIDSSGNGTDSSSDDSGSGSSTADGDGSGSSGVPSSVQPEPSRDWSRQLPCNDIFCLVVRFINEPEPQYEENTNCIQCHVQYIVETLKETTSVGLTPGKLTGNLFEPALCKSALLETEVNLNFLAVPMPIRTPPSDDLITGLSFCTNLGDLVERSNGNLYGMMFDSMCEGDNPELNDEEKHQLRQYYQRGLTDAIDYEESIAPSSASASEIFENALSAYEDELEEVEQAFNDSLTRSRMVSSATDFYASVGQEMDQMNLYFSGFKTILGLTQELLADMEKNLKRAD